MLRNPDLRFEERADGVIRVWVNDEQAWVDLTLDEHGDIAGAKTTTRTRGDVGTQPWEGCFSDYRDFGGLRAPARGEVKWETPGGDYLYWRGGITALTWLMKA